MSAKKKGFNEYTIKGETTIIHIKRRNGDTYNCLIDTEDLQKLIDLNYSWNVSYDPGIGGFYAKTTIYYGKINDKYKYSTDCIHRIIMNAEKGDYIDHINHDTLDNRKSNLRIVDNSTNSINRRAANKNNKTGHKNITYNEKINKYTVQVSINKKNTRLGDFETLEEAIEFAKQKRKELKQYQTQ